MKDFIMFVEKADAYVRLNHSRTSRFLSSILSWIAAFIIIKNYVNGTISDLQLETPNFGLWILLFLGMSIILFIFVVDVCRIIRFLILKFHARKPQENIDLSLQRYINRKVKMSSIFQLHHPDSYKEFKSKILEIGEIDKRGKVTLRVDGVLRHTDLQKFQLHVELILID